MNEIRGMIFIQYPVNFVLLGGYMKAGFPINLMFAIARCIAGNTYHSLQKCKAYYAKQPTCNIDHTNKRCDI